VSLDEQKTLTIPDVPGDQTATETESKQSFKHEQFGKWETVATAGSSTDTKSVDLQLPARSFVAVKRTAPVEEKEPEVEFKEKTAQTSASKSKSGNSFEFKKRKVAASRSMRQRSDD
jgi:hypothetical protein